MSEISSEEVRESGLTLRALVIGIVLLIVFNTYGMIAGGLATTEIMVSTVTGVPTLFLMFILLIVSSTFLRKRGFSASELLVIFTILGSSFFVDSIHYGFSGILYSKLWSPHAESIRSLQPSFWFPNVAEMTPMLMGGAAVPWDAWVVPLAFWLLYSLSIVSFNLFFALIYSHRIINVERLPFPLASAYIHVIDEPRKPFMERTGIKLLLVGLIIGFIFQSTYDLLPSVIPGFPDIWPRDFIGLRALDLGPVFNPGGIYGNQLLFIPLTGMPSMIATFFLIPSSVVGTALLVQVIAFNILPLIQVRMGIQTAISQFGLYSVVPFVFNQVGTAFEPTGIQLQVIGTYGFVVGVGLVYILLSGRTLADSFMSAVKGGKTGPFSSRLLWLGFIGSLAIYFALNLLSAVPVQAALVFALMTLLIMHVGVRIAGEAFGLITGALEGMRSNFQSTGFQAIGGEAARGTPQLYSTMALGFANQYFPAQIPWSTMMSIRLCEMTKKKTKWSSVVIAAMASFIISNIVAFIIYIWGAYTWGFEAKWTGMVPGVTEVDDYISRLLTPGLPQYSGTAEMRVWPELIVGILIAAVVTVMKFQFTWFPIHPMGLILGSTVGWGVVFWFSALIAFILRILVLRIGGAELYEKKGVPLAIGVMIGSGICVFIWALVLIAQTLG